MRLVESPLVEKLRVFPLKHLGAEVAANRIVALVPQNRRHHQQTDHQWQTKQAHTSEGTDDEQQGIAG